MRNTWNKRDLVNPQMINISNEDQEMIKHIIWTMHDSHTLLEMSYLEDSLYIYIKNDSIVVGMKKGKEEQVTWVPYLPLAIGALHNYIKYHESFDVNGNGSTSILYENVNESIEDEIIRWLAHENSHSMKGEA